MTIIKVFVISGIVFYIYFMLFVVKWFEYENKQMNDILKYDDSVNLIAINEVEK